MANQNAPPDDFAGSYHFLFDETPVGIVVTETQTGRILRANSAFHQMLGYNMGALIGQSIISLISPDDLPQTLLHLGHLISGEVEGFEIEKRYLHQDGSPVWSRATVRVLRQKEGDGPDAMLIVAQDIQQHKRAEAELRASESRYRVLMELATDAVVVVNLADTCITGVNAAATEMLGYSRAELLDLNVETIVAPAWWPAMQALIGRIVAGENIREETALRRKDGTTVAVEVSGNLLPDGRIQGVLRDISERQQAEARLRESEERFRAVFENGIDAMFIIDEAGQIVDANPAACMILSRRHDQVVGRSLSDLLPASTHEELARRGQALRQIGQLAGELPVPSTSGILRYFKFSAKAHYVPGYHLIVASDVTAQRAAAAERQARAEAEAANTAKTEFLSRMSHHLRTPLNAMLGFAQLLNMGDLSPVEKESVEHIMIAGRHLLELVNDVLDITHIEQGGIPLNSSAVDLNQLIGECIAQLAELAARKEISILFDPAPEERQIAWADRERLRKVLVNLLSNAVQYNRPGGRVEITVNRIFNDEPITNGHGHAAAPRVRVSIADTGLGIDADEIPLLFQPFERLDAGDDGIEGLGLGLVMARLLVEAMNGTIGVNSTPGEGSTFWIELPLAAVTTTPQAPA